MIVYVDAAYSKKVSGMGAVVLLDGNILIRLGAPAPTSLSKSSQGAEACSILFGLDLAKSIEVEGKSKSDELVILTDCKTVADGIYVPKRRPEHLEALIRRIAKEINKVVEDKIFPACRVEVIRRGENLAHKNAVEARFLWTTRQK